MNTLTHQVPHPLRQRILGPKIPLILRSYIYSLGPEWLHLTMNRSLSNHMAKQ